MTTYAEWSELHSGLFGMTSEKEGSLMILWESEFKAAGFEPDELCAASRDLAFRRGTVNQREHVQTLAGIVREHREVKAAAEQREQWKREQREAKPADVGLIRHLTRGIGNGGIAGEQQRD